MDERLELLANGEVLARYYRHPATLAHAVEAGASWEQIGAARGASAEQARRDYREWAEGQHDLWTGKWGGEPGRCGLGRCRVRRSAPPPGAGPGGRRIRRDATRGPVNLREAGPGHVQGPVPGRGVASGA